MFVKQIQTDLQIFFFSKKYVQFEQLDKKISNFSLIFKFTSTNDIDVLIIDGFSWKMYHYELILVTSIYTRNIQLEKLRKLLCSPRLSTLKFRTLNYTLLHANFSRCLRFIYSHFQLISTCFTHDWTEYAIFQSPCAFFVSRTLSFRRAIYSPFRSRSCPIHVYFQLTTVHLIN